MQVAGQHCTGSLTKCTWAPPISKVAPRDFTGLMFRSGSWKMNLNILIIPSKTQTSYAHQTMPRSQNLLPFSLCIIKDICGRAGSLYFGIHPGLLVILITRWPFIFSQVEQCGCHHKDWRGRWALCGRSKRIPQQRWPCFMQTTMCPFSRLQIAWDAVTEAW